jgi:hypothetical protein
VKAAQVNDAAGNVLEGAADGLGHQRAAPLIRRGIERHDKIAGADILDGFFLAIGHEDGGAGEEARRRNLNVPIQPRSRPEIGPDRRAIDYLTIPWREEDNTISLIVMTIEIYRLET